ncbi:proton channel OTOP3-like [Myxocyprinus asiaticus]|uniref:proton channel OTOP3-like n=1 Tax=Myxocyprinus asiaticus TaxID=70543 RepID=UPI002223E299|nr:proton channel OTOP3-like [Myxocyprinus asiaticus]
MPSILWSSWRLSLLWYLLWAQRQTEITSYTDHHAEGVTVKVILLLFMGCSLLLCMFKMGYFILMRRYRPACKVIFPFVEAPFIALQMYLLWAHSKDSVIITRSSPVPEWSREAALRVFGLVCAGECVSAAYCVLPYAFCRRPDGDLHICMTADVLGGMESDLLS